MNQISFLIVLISEAFAVDLIKAKECTTPYKEKAICLPIASCEVISSVLFTLTPRAIQFVKDSQCGCDSGMVCCGTSNDKPYPQLVNCVPILKSKIGISSDITVCGLHASTDRIRGGSVVQEAEFPWLAALDYKNKRTKANAGIRCGGSVISYNHILTAAHCIWDEEFEIIKVWLGVTSITLAETCSNQNVSIRCLAVQKLNVKKTITHEFYNSLTKFNDIALLELESDIQYSDYVRPICLPSSIIPVLPNNTRLTVVGWGITEKGKTSDVKLKVQVPLKHNSVCENYLRHRNITSKQLCVGGERGQDSCEGDSGGPLMFDFGSANGDVQWVQLGVVSYGTGCGIEGKPGVYVKVSSYRRWIYHKINDDPLGIDEDEPCSFKDGTVGTCVEEIRCQEIIERIFTKSEYYTYQNQIQSYSSRLCEEEPFSPLICCKNPSSITLPIFNTTSVLPDETTCGIVKEDSEIKDDKANLPWIVSVEVSTGQDNSTKIRCIGTIIHSRYVLSTVQCVFGSKEEIFEPINVWLGHWNSTPDNDNSALKIGIKKIIPYPFSHNYINNFIALILLENEIQFSDYIGPICLDARNLPRLRFNEKITFLGITESITSDTIIKHKLPILICWGRFKFHCGLNGTVHTSPVPHGGPVMRIYKDKVSGRIQWYIVAADERLNFDSNINNALDWIITIITIM